MAGVRTKRQFSVIALGSVNPYEGFTSEAIRIVLIPVADCSREVWVLSNQNMRFEDSPPNPEDFVRLRAECGWGDITLEAAIEALSGSVIDLTCFDGTELVGMGRIVGDGALYFYLQDIIVKSTQQGQAIGGKIVSKLTDKALARAQIGATIGLMSAKGKEGLYEHFGFQERPNDHLGAGMSRFVLSR